MDIRKIVILFLAPLALISLDSHGRSTNACFTRDEVVMMIEKRESFSKSASDCMKQYWDTHQKFFRQNHYSKYFGNRNKQYRDPDQRKKEILLALWPDFPSLLRPELAQAWKNSSKLSDFEKVFQVKNPVGFQDYQSKIAPLQLDARAAEEPGEADVLRPNTDLRMQNISCVDMTRRCLSFAFQQTGMNETWKKIDKEVMAADKSGVVLQKALGDLGWKIFFWDPDTTQAAAWDQEEQQLSPIAPAAEGEKPKTWQSEWGGHALRWAVVQKRNEYILGTKEKPIPIDDKELLVNFGKNVPEKFKAVPFFVGTAHSGYHVFPGFFGKIIEAHSMRQIRSFDNLEVSLFNPLDQDNKGGPRWTRSERYRSGVIVVPPGYLENGPLTLHEPQMDGACVDIRPSKDPAPAAGTGTSPPPAAPNAAPATPPESEEPEADPTSAI